MACCFFYAVVHAVNPVVVVASIQVFSPIAVVAGVIFVVHFHFESSCVAAAVGIFGAAAVAIFAGVAVKVVVVFVGSGGGGGGCGADAGGGAGAAAAAVFADADAFDPVPGADIFGCCYCLNTSLIAMTVTLTLVVFLSPPGLRTGPSTPLSPSQASMWKSPMMPEVPGVALLPESIGSTRPRVIFLELGKCHMVS